MSGRLLVVDDDAARGQAMIKLITEINAEMGVNAERINTEVLFLGANEQGAIMLPDDRRYIVSYPIRNHHRESNMSMGRHSGIAAIAVALGMGALAGHPSPLDSGNPFASRESDNRFDTGRSHYSKGSKCQMRFDHRAARKRNKAQRKARIAAAHVRGR
jgi:hypothetical protein